MVSFETYSTIAVSLSHLCQDGLEWLDKQANSKSNQRMLSRDTGYFVKLYGNEYDFFEAAPESILSLFHLANEAGVRLIEFDTDVEPLDDWPVYECSLISSQHSPSISGTIYDAYNETKKSADVTVHLNKNGLTIDVGQYSNSCGSEVIHLEVHRDELILFAWADLEQEEHTDMISLEGAFTGR